MPGEYQKRTRIVVATFNIRYAVGSYLITGSLLRRVGLMLPRRRPSLIARHIEKAARCFKDGKRMPRADIVALQEADKFTLRAGGTDIAAELATRLALQWRHLGTDALQSEAATHSEDPKPKQWYLDFEERIAPDEGGTTGLAILSRLPISEAMPVDLPYAECAWRPRLAMYAKISTPRGDLHIFNSHIDPHAAIDEQLAQHTAVLKRAATIKQDEPVMLLGDFNTLTKASRRAMHQLLEAHGYISATPDNVATWRAGLVRLHTDWIFTRGVRVMRWGVARGLGVSDHWPVWVEIELIDGASV
ncbi:MAG: endonuclease/exonuclease/phosphatase family protein [Pyrinomonadaceae bacterium]